MGTSVERGLLILACMRSNSITLKGEMPPLETWTRSLVNWSMKLIKTRKSNAFCYMEGNSILAATIWVYSQGQMIWQKLMMQLVTVSRFRWLACYCLWINLKFPLFHMLEVAVWVLLTLQLDILLWFIAHLIRISKRHLWTPLKLLKVPLPTLSLKILVQRLQLRSCWPTGKWQAQKWSSMDLLMESSIMLVMESSSIQILFQLSKSFLLSTATQSDGTWDFWIKPRTTRKSKKSPRTRPILSSTNGLNQTSCPWWWLTKKENSRRQKNKQSSDLKIWDVCI